jgi:UDP-N-acetylglucosamine:LPS N-acetylglucosamine transferase
MPSEFCADFYDRKSDKNLYLGIPKYDLSLQKNKILEKYNLPINKKSLIIWPKSRDENKINMDKILNSLKTAGYTLLVKTRGKDSLSGKASKILRANGDFYFEDNSWYPHTTQELLEISDFAVNFGSTTIEECIMHDVPLINFDVKPAVRNGSRRPYRVTHEYLYNYNYCIQLEKDFSQAQLSAAVNYLTSTDLTEEFKKARQNHLFDHKDSCKRILDVLI